MRRTGEKIKVCTWLREISSCSCLTFLPGPAWLLLSKTYKPLFTPLYFHYFRFSGFLNDQRASKSRLASLPERGRQCVVNFGQLGSSAKGSSVTPRCWKLDGRDIFGEGDQTNWNAAEIVIASIRASAAAKPLSSIDRPTMMATVDIPFDFGPAIERGIFPEIDKQKSCGQKNAGRMEL